MTFCKLQICLGFIGWWKELCWIMAGHNIGSQQIQAEIQVKKRRIKRGQRTTKTIKYTTEQVEPWSHIHAHCPPPILRDKAYCKKQREEITFSDRVQNSNRTNQCRQFGPRVSTSFFFFHASYDGLSHYFPHILFFKEAKLTSSVSVWFHFIP